MKKLFALVLLAIIVAGVASPVYAQGEYPPQKCSDSYWEGVNPDDCVAYYENHYPGVATGCGELDAFDCVARYEKLIFAETADQTVDVPAGGEGPNTMSVNAVWYYIGCFCIGWVVADILKFVFDTLL